MGRCNSESDYTGPVFPGVYYGEPLCQVNGRALLPLHIHCLEHVNKLRFLCLMLAQEGMTLHVFRGFQTQQAQQGGGQVHEADQAVHF